MKNWEKFEDEIKTVVSGNGSLAVKDGKPVNCGDILCNECIAESMKDCEKKDL